MRFITTNDIEIWANTVECKYHLPHLFRKLILDTIDKRSIRHIHFPYGEDVQTGGFDGELDTESENTFVPLGESVWEFGTTNKKKGKADEDYEKRKLDTLGKIPSETTYININAKKYRDKNKWTDEKKAEGFWKDVKYIDAIDIEQWLELAPTVELWLAEKLRKPTLGIYTVEEYWKCWSENKTLKVIPEILLGNSRQKEITAVESFLTSNESVLYIKSITTDEATAFPLAVFKKLNPENEKLIVIDNRESFNRFIQTRESLIILLKFKIESTDLRGAIQKGHKIIIPISLSDEVNISEKIQLPIVSRDTFESSLKIMGLDSEQARILTKNSGRNISVLKRLLKFDDSTKPKYLDNIDIINIIPILLINRFSEDCDGDKEIIEKLSGKTSSEYIQFLRILANLEDSPVYYINGVWRLISPTDTWLYFAKYVTSENLGHFQEICLEVLSETLHKYTIPLDDRKNYFLTPQNRSKYSSKLKEGVCESLVVLSTFGHNYGINSISNVPLYVDNIVKGILEMNVLIWRSLSSNLMLLAEASPEVFLSNLERIIKDNSVLAFFEVEEGFLHSSNDLAPLLWCLDIIAWFPENLMRVSNSLCDLILLSPDSFPTSNTPLSNLISIFRTWYPQTNTSAEDRKKILEILTKKYPEISYNLFYKLVDSKFDTAFHTPRPKWKLFSELRDISVPQREVYYMRGFCLDSIIELSKNNLSRILSLIDLLDDMEWDKIDTVLNLIEMSAEFGEKERTMIYHKFRKFIGNHKSHPTANWALPNDVLEKIESIAILFKPDNDILNESYLFEEHYPDFIEGRQGDDYRKHDEEILSRRVNFVETIINKYGIDKIFDLANEIEHPYLYGNALAYSDKLKDLDKLATYRLIESTNPKCLSIAQSFIRISENRTNLQTQIPILISQIESGLSINGQVNFLNSLKNCIDLWRFISTLNNDTVEKLYWKLQQGFIYTENKNELLYALDKLQQFNKPITQLNTLGWGLYKHKDDLTSEEVLTILERISFEDLDDSSRFDHHNFRNILEFLYSKNDYDIERGAKIEMKFIFVFTGGSYHPSPKNLYQLMSQKSEEYFGILSQVYLPDEPELKEDELEKLKENPNYLEIFKAGWEILDSFNLIPSLQADGTLDSAQLTKWVYEVRELASQNHRAQITDDCIGKLLAKYPINMKEHKGFPTIIYDLVEEIGTDEIKIAFSVQLSNNLSFTTRGAFDGGDIERSRADYFNLLLEETKFTHPNTSNIFKNMRDRYLLDAKRQDESALLRSLE